MPHLTTSSFGTRVRATLWQRHAINQTGDAIEQLYLKCKTNTQKGIHTMTYKLRTVDGKFNRLLNDEDFRTVLRIALKYGWTPSPRHLRGGYLWLNESFNEQEAKALAMAIDKAIQREGANLLPPVIVAFLECIGVLRRGPSKFFYVTPQ